MNVFGLDVVSTIDPFLSKSICYDMNTWKRGFFRFENYPSLYLYLGDFGWKVDIEVFGGGVLFAIDGEEWKTRRKNLNKFFSSKNLLSYSSSIKEACSKMCSWINYQG
jgi:cytochrome P450